MIIQIHNYGSRKDKEPSYWATQGPIIYGDLDFVDIICRLLHFDRTYCSGTICLAGNEKLSPKDTKLFLDDLKDFVEVDGAVKVKLVAWKFEKNGRSNISFCIPRVDLNTGLAYNPTPPGYERRWSAFADVQAIKFDLMRPNRLANTEMATAKTALIDASKRFHAYAKDRYSKKRVVYETPPDLPRELLTKNIVIRMTGDEKNVLRELAQDHKVSISAFVRHRLWGVIMRHKASNKGAD